MITLAIVGMWIWVLAPVVLRRHGRTHEMAGVDQFRSAMGVLSRRAQRRHPGQMVVMPARGVRFSGPEVAPGGRVPDRVGGGGGSGEPTGPRPARGFAAPPAETSAVGTPRGRATTSQPRRGPSASSAALARRRRRLLGGLAVFAALTLLVAAAAGGAWLGLQVVADVLLVADLVYLRRMTRRAHLARQRAAAAAARARRSEWARAAAGLAGGVGVPEGVGTPAVSPRPAPSRPAPARVRLATEGVAPAPGWTDDGDEGIRLLTGTDAATAPRRPPVTSFAGNPRPTPSEAAASPTPRRRAGAPTAPAPVPRAAGWSPARPPAPAGGGAPAGTGPGELLGSAGATAAPTREPPGSRPPPPAPAGTQLASAAGSPLAQPPPDPSLAPGRGSRPPVVFDDPLDTAPLGRLLADSAPPPVYDLTGGSGSTDHRQLSEDGVEIDVLIGRRAVND